MAFIIRAKGTYGELMTDLLTETFHQRHGFSCLLVPLVEPSVDRLKGEVEAGGKFDETNSDRLWDVGNNEDRV
ncbi:hypothetical protein TIFTF001_038299 [Ficus carica]|uniref:Uncharacterized protein n=1 Tax=Ficus carica TaxID=3494 RepID=A0AA88E7Q7_FICCA|nr:hypothetical protein TIFTF001_038299 [Ficus carica]